ncbi:hypothetical protein GEMRC1_004158 [Eukaryota sp. GEM-RC1]
MFITVVPSTFDQLLQPSYQRELNKLVKILPFSLPVFKTENLDTLLRLLDDLKTLDESIRQLIYRLDSYIDDFTKVKNASSNKIQSSLEHGISWNQSKFSLLTPIPELVHELDNVASTIDEQLRDNTSEHSKLTATHQELSKKVSGPLSTRSVNDLLVNTEVISTDSLVTILIVIPSADINRFVNTYETVSEYVVPRSAQLVIADASSSMYAIVVYRPKLDVVQEVFSNSGWIVRMDHLNTKASNEGTLASRLKEMTLEMEDMRASLIHWVDSALDEVVSLFFHLKFIVCRVEALLRFGPISSDSKSLMIIPQRVGVKSRVIELFCRTLASEQFFRGDTAISEEDLPFVFGSIECLVLLSGVVDYSSLG